MFQRGDEVTSARVADPAIGWWCKVQHDAGQPGNALEADWLVKVGKDRADPLIAPESCLLHIAQQGKDLVVTEQARQGTARNIASADDQQFLAIFLKFFHSMILPDTFAGSFDGFSDQA